MLIRDPEFAEHNQEIQLPRYGFSEFPNLVNTSELRHHPAVARTEPRHRARDAAPIRRGLRLATERGLMFIQSKAYPDIDTYSWTPVGFALASALRRSRSSMTDPFSFRLHNFLAALPQHIITQLCLLPGPKQSLSYRNALESIGIVRIRARTGTVELCVDPHAFIEFFQLYPSMIPQAELLEIHKDTKPADRRELESFHQALNALREGGQEIEADELDELNEPDFKSFDVTEEPDFDIAYEDEWDIL